MYRFSFKIGQDDYVYHKINQFKHIEIRICIIQLFRLYSFYISLLNTIKSMIKYANDIEYKSVIWYYKKMMVAIANKD